MRLLLNVENEKSAIVKAKRILAMRETLKEEEEEVSRADVHEKVKKVRREGHNE